MVLRESTRVGVFATACLFLACAGCGTPDEGVKNPTELTSPCRCFGAAVRKLDNGNSEIVVKIHRTAVERRVEVVSGPAELFWIEPPGGNVLIVNYHAKRDQCLAYFPGQDKKLDLGLKPVAEVERTAGANLYNVRAAKHAGDASVVNVTVDGADASRTVRQTFVVKVADGSIVSQGSLTTK